VLCVAVESGQVMRSVVILDGGTMGRDRMLLCMLNSLSFGIVLIVHSGISEGV
jgi:hypothetical protein